MAALNWLSKTAAEQQFIAAAQASSVAKLDAREGSVTLAWGQGANSLFLWLQGLLAKVLLLTRAATSKGTDLDAWMAQFFFDRLPAQFATGVETFARFQTTTRTVVPIGSIVSTGPSGVRFIVTTDTANPAYDSSSAGYVLDIGTASVDVPITALVGGSSSNVLGGTITSFQQPIVGIDTATNAAPITNGTDAELDAPFLARFKDYILGLRAGTPSAIRAAVMALRQGLTCTIIENKLADGTTDNGFLTIVVDDGTGSPSSDLVSAASQAVETVRAAGIRYAVMAPTILEAAIAFSLDSIDATKHASDVISAQDAVKNYVNALPPGAKLVWARIYQLAFDASENISDVSDITINAATADLVPTAVQIIKTSTVTGS